MNKPKNKYFRRILFCLTTLLTVVILFTVFADVVGEREPHNSVEENIDTHHIMPQKSYSTAPGMTIKIVYPDYIVNFVDSIVVEFSNTRKDEGMTGEWFKIERLHEDSTWRKIPYDKKYENADVIVNDVGYGVSPDRPLKMTIKPWLYEKRWKPGKYRIAKKFHFPPYPIEKDDTAFVEFEIIN